MGAAEKILTRALGIRGDRAKLVAEAIVERLNNDHGTALTVESTLGLVATIKDGDKIFATVSIVKSEVKVNFNFAEVQFTSGRRFTPSDEAVDPLVNLFNTALAMNKRGEAGN